MPKVFEKKHKGKHLMVWKIEEELSFFASAIRLNKEESEDYNQIRFLHRKLEWMAARYVQRLLVQDTLRKDSFGKPHLNTEKGHVSISHCKGFAAAIYSKKEEVGIDIEPIHEKILRIASKFTNTDEFAHISDEIRVKQLITNWCIKEAIYKKYGKKSLNFKEQIRISPYNFTNCEASITLALAEKNENHTVYFKRIENVMLAYT